MKPGLILAIIMGLRAAAPGQAAPDGAGDTRQWTSADGRVISAEYLGVKGTDVLLKLPGGKIVPVPLAKLSVNDQTFVNQNPRKYTPPWTTWPSEASVAIPTVNVTEAKGESGEFIYETPHYRFHVDGNLGTPLMKELARVFELTYNLHTNAPFGLLAEPLKDRFEARLFGKTSTYHAEGGPEHTAGVYYPPKKVFLAPLDMMGVRSDGNVWRRMAGSDYDTSTVVHELTHMFTHELLDKLPTWMNEGYAEYISNIPLEGNSFRPSTEKIREGVLDSLVPNHYSTDSGVTKVVRIQASDRRKFFDSGKLPSFCKVSDVLTLTNTKWAASSTNSSPNDYSTRQALYRTSHLILYYYIQLEGAKGVAKLQAFLDENRKGMSAIDAYQDALRTYHLKMEEFFKLPGVVKLPGGKFRYPSKLTPPVAPKAPEIDYDKLRLAGLPKLLDGLTAEAMGSKIQEALVKDLKVDIKFDRQITTDGNGSR